LLDYLVSRVFEQPFTVEFENVCRQSTLNKITKVQDKDYLKFIIADCYGVDCLRDKEGWKNKIYSVFDGGIRYFNFKINLTTKKYYRRTANAVS
jgi:hypothetical protein